MKRLSYYLLALFGILLFAIGCEDSGSDLESPIYTVTFSSMGGSPVNAKIAHSGQKITEPVAPTKEGHTFGGWYKEAACENAWNFAAEAVLRNTILFAKWIPDEIPVYTVTFDSQDGSFVESQAITSGEKVLEPEEPEKDDHVFAGWYREDTFETLWDFDTDVVTQETTLYAKWLGIFTVTFDSQEGSEIDPQTKIEGEKVDEPGEEPEKAGYVFSGWHKDDTFETLWDFDEDMVMSDMTLYALWVEETSPRYDVTFNSMGGSAVEKEKVYENTKITEPDAPTKETYVFGGWYKETELTNKWDFNSDKVTGAITLYAKWIPTYAFEFNSMEGSSVEAQTVTEGEKADEPTAPTRENYVFGGWYKEIALTNEWNFTEDVVTEATTVFAKWIPTYTVTFNSTEGSAVAPQTIVEGEKADEPTAPTREDYLFGGWYKEIELANEWNFTEDVVTEATTIYAKWIPIHTVTFNSMEGTPVGSQKITEGEKASEPATPTKEDRVLAGWYKEIELTNKWDFATDIVTENTTLFAKWVPARTVTFNSNGGSAVSDQTVGEGLTASLPYSTTQPGFIFKGWYKDESFQQPWDFATDVVTENITLYAKWEATSYPGCVFIAPNGNDENNGSFAAPFKTLGKAKTILDAGTVDTIYIRGGTYHVTSEEFTRSDNTWAYIFDFSTAGGSSSASTSKRKCVYGFPGERPVFDLSAAKPENKRIRVFNVDRSYYHFKNFEIIGTQVVQTGHTQSECFRNIGGNNNIYENLSMHDGMAIGFYLSKGVNNLILNCDAYNNHDDYSGESGNVDGFGGHPDGTTSVGNVFRGCRAWYNGDDGFDLISANAAVVIDNCWSFYNGYISGTTSSGGDGAGFKSGGYGMRNDPKAPNPVPMHTVKNCLAYYNRQQGFYANHHLAGIYWYNNTAYRNPNNFNMTNRETTATDSEDVPGYGHVLMNNLSYSPRTSGRDIYYVNEQLSTLSHNSFQGMTITDNDFISLNWEELKYSRKPDGSLPDINFLKPKAGSQLIGAGTAEAGTGNTNIGCF